MKINVDLSKVSHKFQKSKIHLNISVLAISQGFGILCGHFVAKMVAELPELLCRVNFPLYQACMVSPRHLLLAGGGGAAKTGVFNGFVSAEGSVSYHPEWWPIPILRILCNKPRYVGAAKLTV